MKEGINFRKGFIRIVSACGLLGSVFLPRGLAYTVFFPQAQTSAFDRLIPNKNFGLIFSIWDRMFGTLYNKYDEYDYDTGIDDEYFPIEESAKGLGIFKNWLAQFIYPFRQILGR